MALSPMMQQYREIKANYQDCLLFYRLGDFYELFFDDAYTASRELELTLTGRNCGLEERAPMCGVPFHAADAYIAKLVERGYKVAICEQVEDPKEAKGIVRREVIRIVTPGTIDLSGAAANGENIYLVSAYPAARQIAIAYADITTGEMVCTSVSRAGGTDRILAELSRLAPREIIFDPGIDAPLMQEIQDQLPEIYLNPVDASYYKRSACEKMLLQHFGVASLIPLDLDGREELAVAAGSLLLYLTEMQKQDPAQFKVLEVRESDHAMQLDRATMRNLELLETLYDKQVRGSLLGVLDRTHTAMGARLLKRMIKEPLIDPDMINDRLEAVEALRADLQVRNRLTASLREIYDFERLTARIASGRANGKDLVALKSTLAALPPLTADLREVPSVLTDRIRISIADFDSLYRVIDASITEEPPFLLTEGGLIKAGFSAELDALKESIRDAQEWIAGLEQSEKERTGIKTIMVGYNTVFGYYIDVSKSYLDMIPDNYIRKQTLVNNERYITPELKEKESLVMSAEAKINKLEYEIFRQIRTSIEPYIRPLQEASQAVALLDVLVSFADVASRNGYVRPVVDDSHIIEIRDGRHPSVEQMVGEGLFVANDTELDQAGKSMLIITGPNMSGKSTYMRQTAIIVLMAQIGSFVPCSSARIGVCDRVFTRIGASDNLSSGQSTFFIEMSELAHILRNATGRSLILLDEIGRGTSTFDGLSIAWATIEYLCSRQERVRTMFATHYHELTVLEDRFDAVRNLSVAVSEKGKDIVFLHKIVDGPASKSYGIHVAKIAGIPASIRKSAQAKLRQLESNERQRPMSEQLSIFDNMTFEEVQPAADPYGDIVRKLRHLDLNQLTPMKALLTLQEIQDEIREISEE